MANWKEKGVVPDSDDEDALDSQSTASNPHSDNEERNAGPPSFENVIETCSIIEGGEDLKENNLGGSRTAPPVAQDNLFAQSLPVPLLASELEKSANPHVDGHHTALDSSPHSPNTFKVPKAFWEPEDDDVPEQGDEAVSKFERGAPAGDQISRSYVQITSPTSSILSSLPGSQFSLPPNASTSRRTSTPPQDRTQEVLMFADHCVANVQALATTTYTGRSLRQRNPIQLHPYMMEQEKYRQTLKARGIAPMRIALSQEEAQHRPRHTACPELDSQERYSQGATEMGDSQPMDFDWNPLLSSPQKPSEQDVANEEENDESIQKNDDDEDEDDEEFPDIDELLSTRLPLPPQVGSSRRIKPYSTKTKRHILSRVQTQFTGNGIRNATSSSVFHVPASPPATRSPFPDTSRHPVSSMSQARSRSPEQSTHTRLTQSGPNLQRPADLPTPATSVTKPILIAVDSDSDDRFASERDMSSQASSSDEEIQIRKVSKKIRGVLPASHLRLDYQQKNPQAPSRKHRDSLSISPIKTSTRRGVALPKVSGLAQSPSSSAVPGFEFLSDDSNEDDEENRESGFIFEESSPLDSLFSQSRLGLAEEDDRIDAMLPPRKRHSTSSRTQQRKRKRVGSRTSSWAINGSHTRRLENTEHLKQPRQAAFRTRPARQARKSASAPRRHDDNQLSLARKLTPPRLSILDVADVPSNDIGGLPQFIKIAARTARSRIGQGKQSPSRKFIRLANREDTHDAQSVLEDWRQGRIHPKSSIESLHHLGRPLREIRGNSQTILQPPMPKMRPRTQISNIGALRLRRKLFISRCKQQSMNEFVTREQSTTQQPNISLRQDHTSKLAGHPKVRPRYIPPAARFAQLESSEVEHSQRHLATAFRSTKKTLDALFRVARKRPVLQANLQLNRFLADEDVARPSIEAKNVFHNVESGITSQRPNDHVHNKSRRKKRSPQRLDAGAAVYRQPSNPLILDTLVSACPPGVAPVEAPVEGRKLLGLAKFGAHYPLHFDIFPLQPGVFFHENTFIGSGRLSEAIQGTRELHLGIIRPHTSLMVAGKTFSWGQWTEDVSSEVGVSFDWLVDKLVGQTPPLSSPSTVDAVGVVSFVLEYVHHHLSFVDYGDVKNFLCRMAEILQDLSSRLEGIEDSSKSVEARSGIEVTSMTTLLLLELLRIARAQHEESLTHKLEYLLKKFAALCVKALLSQGLDRIRKLYDDLQYVSIRERGINSDEFVAQAWVIVMKVLDVARIPRGSFWDVTNSQLIGTSMKDISDARMMEELWYSIYSVLPLCEFDEFGVVIGDQRQKASFDNWSLSQQMLKRIFVLYSSNQRQSPGFNDYCRSVVSRCHYLMVEWGWWNCSGVIGTLFDFFGSHSLSNLRNEEAYDSPHFLQELDTEPHLWLEPEDRCFHIFLKIVALAIKHFRQVGEGKSIRNLVARLMPNHNRQYPKEKPIHQRDLASLRNHHDLLCTLYWAAPSQYRPPPALIQDLITADDSHKEACLINLRAWQQLARFILTHPDERAAYQPLQLWHRDFVHKLFQQYLQITDEIRDQAHALEGASKQIMQEHQLQEIIMVNRANQMALICSALNALSDLILVSMPLDGEDTLEVEIDSILTRLTLNTYKDHFGRLCYMNDEPSRALLDAYLRLINIYMDRVDKLCAPLQDGNDISEAHYLVVRSLSHRVENALGLPLLELVKHLLKAPKETTLSIAGVNTLYKKLMACWARSIALATDFNEKNNDDVDPNFLNKCIATGPDAVFRDRFENEVADYYWPHFLAELVKYKRSVDFENTTPQIFDFGKEWLLALTNPNVDQSFLINFTAQLQEKGFAPSKGIHPQALPAVKLRGAIRNMGLHTANTLTYKSSEIKARYSSMLIDVMKAIEHHLKAMDTSGPKFYNYLKDVQKVAAEIKCHAGDICQLSLFFLVASPHYQPDPADPEFFTAGTLKYCLQLSRQMERTPSEFFHYLTGSWKKVLIYGETKMRQHILHLKKTMKNENFMVFLLVDFVPAIIRTGFRSFYTQASLIHLVYLPNLASRVAKLLNGDDAEASTTFRLVINLLRIFMNCLFAKKDYTVIPRFPCPQRRERSVRTVACQFWLEVTPSLMNYVQRIRNKVPEDEQAFWEVHKPFFHYMERMAKCLDPPYTCENDWMIPQWPVVNGQYCAKFEADLEADIRACETDKGCRGIKIGTKIHWVDLSHYEEMAPTFESVLQYGHIGYDEATSAVGNSLIRGVVP